MSAMLRGSLESYSAVVEASLIAVVFFSLFAIIAFLVFRPKSKAAFDRAERLPLDDGSENDIWRKS